MFEIVYEFLEGRKQEKIKKKIKDKMSEGDKQSELEKISSEFLLENWIVNAAKRAGQLSLVTHPAKFSHPDAKTSIIFVDDRQKRRVDNGYLYASQISGLQDDVVGNAAALDVLKFLKLETSDGKTILEHVENKSDEIKEFFSKYSLDFGELRKLFLNIKYSDEESQTDAKVKQVYFPVGQDSAGECCYHLLSILTPSGLIFRAKERIDKIRFADEYKQAREDRKNKRYNADGYADLYNLTSIGYGGSKPQNISDLNSKNGGKAYLLPSLPPKLEKNKLILPKKDFFTECLWRQNFGQTLRSWQELLKHSINNKDVRDARDGLVRYIVYQIVGRANYLRNMAEDRWSEDALRELPLYQKYWLDNAYQKERQDKIKRAEIFGKIRMDLSLWVVTAFNEINKARDKKLYDPDAKMIRGIVDEMEDEIMGLYE